jgi:hypothetical protein
MQFEICTYKLQGLQCTEKPKEFFSRNQSRKSKICAREKSCIYLFFIYLLSFFFFFLDFVENKNLDRNGIGLGLTIVSPPKPRETLSHLSVLDLVLMLSFFEPFDQDHVVYKLADRMHVV